MIWIPLSQFNTLMRLSGDSDVGETESQIQQLLSDPKKTNEEKSRRYVALLSKSIKQKKEIEERPAKVIVENLPVKSELPVETPQLGTLPDASPPPPPPPPPPSPKGSKLTPMMKETLDYVMQNRQAFNVLPNKQIKNVNGKPIQHSNVETMIAYLHNPGSKPVPAGYKRFIILAKKDPYLSTLPGVTGQTGMGSIKARRARPKTEKWMFF